jgi:hypothetical protein
MDAHPHLPTAFADMNENAVDKSVTYRVRGPILAVAAEVQSNTNTLEALAQTNATLVHKIQSIEHFTYQMATYNQQMAAHQQQLMRGLYKLLPGGEEALLAMPQAPTPPAVPALSHQTAVTMQSLPIQGMEPQSQFDSNGKKRKITRQEHANDARRNGNPDVTVIPNDNNCMTAKDWWELYTKDCRARKALRYLNVFQRGWEAGGDTIKAGANKVWFSKRTAIFALTALHIELEANKSKADPIREEKRFEEMALTKVQKVVDDLTGTGDIGKHPSTLAINSACIKEFKKVYPQVYNKPFEGYIRSAYLSKHEKKWKTYQVGWSRC